MFFLSKLLKFGGASAVNKLKDSEKPFLDHLEDLRVTLMKVVITLVVSTLIAFVFNKQLIGIIQYPLGLAGIETIGSSFGPVEGFMGVLKICLYTGLICSFPLILVFIGEFIIPGLNTKEKKLIVPVIISSFFLFAAGATFAYFVVIPRALEFFIEFGDTRDIVMDLRFKYAVSFVTMLCLVFGLCFELPVVVMSLVKLDLLNSTMMRNTRSYAIIAMFILAAVITPTPDIFTMSLLAGPMILLYEMCIWMAWWMERKTAKVEAAEKEREHRELIERQKRSKQRDEAKEATVTETAESGSALAKTSAASAGTLAYDPNNEASFEDETAADDDPDSGDEENQDSDVVDNESPRAEVDPTSDAVWDTPLEPATEPEQNDDYDPHHYDHSDHDDGYFSGSTEELKRSLREEISAELKDVIKRELKAELLAELREELRNPTDDAEPS